jgi:hypothetical protein
MLRGAPVNAHQRMVVNTARVNARVNRVIIIKAEATPTTSSDDTRVR